MAAFAKFPGAFLQFFHSANPELLERILSERQESTRELNAPLAEALNAAIDEFEQRVWQATGETAAAAG